MEWVIHWDGLHWLDLDHSRGFWFLEKTIDNINTEKQSSL